MRVGLMILATMGSFVASATPALAVPGARPAATAGCNIALTARPDTDSFTAANRANGAALTQATGVAFSAAATHLCASGIVRPAHLARYRSLMVRNAEGATDPNIYDDAEEHPGVLIIEFAFADGGPPTQAQIEAAMRCWRNPHGAGCTHEDVGP